MRKSEKPFPEMADGRGQPDLGEITADHFLTHTLQIIQGAVSQRAGDIPSPKSLRFEVLFRKLIIPDEPFIDFHYREFNTCVWRKQGNERNLAESGGGFCAAQFPLTTAPHEYFSVNCI